LISHAWFELGHLHVEATGRFHQNGRIGSDDYWSDLEFDQQFECIEKNSKCTPDQSGDPLLTIRNGWGVSVGVTVKFDPQAVLKGTLDITIQYICTTATITQTTTTTAQLGSGIPLSAGHDCVGDVNERKRIHNRHSQNYMQLCRSVRLRLSGDRYRRG
jgi:hypothetical protein